jgi:hypothetical protein
MNLLLCRLVKNVVLDSRIYKEKKSGYEKCLEREIP